MLALVTCHISPPQSDTEKKLIPGTWLPGWQLAVFQSLTVNAYSESLFFFPGGGCEFEFEFDAAAARSKSSSNCSGASSNASSNCVTASSNSSSSMWTASPDSESLVFFFRGGFEFEFEFERGSLWRWDNNRDHAHAAHVSADEQILLKAWRNTCRVRVPRATR